MAIFWRKLLIPNQKYTWSLLLGIMVFLTSADTYRQGISQDIPNPEEASQKAEKFSPEQLTSVEIDEKLRDRLRFDPRWQPILLAVRDDIDTLKWTKTKVDNLKNPIWKRYGAKVYPLLDYYTRFGDPLRQKYGLAGIRSLGKPYTTLWLSKQLQLNRIILAGSYQTWNFSEKELAFLDFFPSKELLEKEFGLNEPKIRQKLIKIAKENLQPKTYIYYYEQLNHNFLIEFLGYNYNQTSADSSFDPNSEPALKKWDQYERLTALGNNQIQEILSYYRNLSKNSQEALLASRLGEIKAGEIHQAGKTLLQNLANDQTSPYRLWSIAELDRHGDPQGSALLEKILNGELKELYSLTTFAGHSFFIPTEFRPRFANDLPGAHAYLLLVAMAHKYPQSKFIKGCREYGDLTGSSYFGGEPRSKEIQKRNASKTPAEKVQGWQQWLSLYGDHPGADDATYHLAKSLQEQNDSLGAMRQWLKLMTQHPGDWDVSDYAWPYVRTLLDVGLSIEQLEIILEENRNKAITPLLKYALAVRQARLHNYAQALQLSNGLDLTKMSTEVLGSYYEPARQYYLRGDLAQLQTQMQAMLTEQRQRWQRLRNWQQENTPESRYRIASNWSNFGGWKNGYLPFWGQNRINHLPILDYGWCSEYWACDLYQRDGDTVRSLYQNASQNAVALSFYEKILADPQTQPKIREKTLYMIASTLLTQWEWHPPEETLAIHPLPGVSGEPSAQKIWQAVNLREVQKQAYQSDPPDYDLLRKATKQWEEAQAQALKAIPLDYQERIDQIIAQLKKEFPQSSYIDDLLFSSYFLSRKPSYLQEIVKEYPNGDRATDAAKFLKQ
ncbi:hypothetical protein [Crocosphaera sp.]|uniref:hypothetical protein n=1 Tax=Crocosphaera sp. TaxID=2729996 RepID=UPI00262EBBFB|nr:hypothetical protein [Crocosphaera sp.]MDJ0578812.1 hypothetical protein [Crocosphaera sp.]